LQTLDKALLAAQAADDRRARDIIVLDLQGITIVTDYFVICSGERGVDALRSEGHEASRWILLDYGDVVVHIFLERERDYYGLERLWGDASRVDLAQVIGT